MVVATPDSRRLSPWQFLHSFSASGSTSGSIFGCSPRSLCRSTPESDSPPNLRPTLFPVFPASLLPGQLCPGATESRHTRQCAVRRHSSDRLVRRIACRLARLVLRSRISEQAAADRWRRQHREWPEASQANAWRRRGFQPHPVPPARRPADPRFSMFDCSGSASERANSRRACCHLSSPPCLAKIAAIAPRRTGIGGQLQYMSENLFRGFQVRRFSLAHQECRQPRLSGQIIRRQTDCLPILTSGLRLLADQFVAPG